MDNMTLYANQVIIRIKRPGGLV